MNNIPQHIIGLFRESYSVDYPCISYIEIPSKEILTKLLSKSETIWFYSDENKEKRVLLEEYVIYDKTGIDVYYFVDENNKYKVFILSKIDKRDIVDFTLHYIKKQIKDYGNNRERVEGKN